MLDIPQTLPHDPPGNGNCPFETVTHIMLHEGVRRFRCEAHGVPAMRRSVALLVIEDAKILSVTRKDKYDDFGLPSGKIEYVMPDDLPTKRSDPTDIWAVKREAREELGVGVTDLIPVWVGPINEPFEGPEYSCTTFMGRLLGRPSTQRNEGLVSFVPPEFLIERSCFTKYHRQLFTFLGLFPLPVPGRTQWP